MKHGKAAAGVSPHAASLDHVHPILGQQMLLFSALINFNLAGDQAFTKSFNFGDFELHAIRVRDATASMTTASGGLYTAAAKAGIILAANQTFVGITAVAQGVNGVLTPAGMAKIAGPLVPIFNLTTLQGGALTATMELFGVALTEGP